MVDAMQISWQRSPLNRVQQPISSPLPLLVTICWKVQLIDHQRSTNCESYRRSRRKKDFTSGRRRGWEEAGFGVGRMNVDWWMAEGGRGGICEGWQAAHQSSPLHWFGCSRAEWSCRSSTVQTTQISSICFIAGLFAGFFYLFLIQ